MLYLRSLKLAVYRSGSVTLEFIHGREARDCTFVWAKYPSPLSAPECRNPREQYALVASGDHLILYDISGESLPVLFEGRTGLVSDLQVSIIPPQSMGEG
ncbi:hypothetical protein [Scytonema sp. NUACC26]|uniref:hypothetical protein n=1 Tax=Scytonema sp. NUACC26 TaxID=3140176 RepID=UPI0034DB8687